MTNKRNRNTSKTLTQDQCALLMLVKTKPFVGKPLGHGPVGKDAVRIRGRRQRRVVLRLKSECVLLKKAR
jgi:hypothetical protein